MSAKLDHIGDPKVTFKFCATLTTETEETHIVMKGHKAAGATIAGGLPCTGLTMWPVAELAANFIASRCDGFLNKKVLEVGCGLGLCGIISAKAVGPHGTVLLTDGDDEVIEIATQNLELNNVTENTHAMNLWWNDLNKIQYVLNVYRDVDSSQQPSYNQNERIKHELFTNPYNPDTIYTSYSNSTTETDSKNDSSGCFDIIVASDCLYRNGNNTKPLFQLAAKMLRRPNTPQIDTILDRGKNKTNKNCTTTNTTEITVNTTNTETNTTNNDNSSELQIEPSGDGGGWYYPMNHDHLNDESVVKYRAMRGDEDDAHFSHSPVFLLAYTRRLDGNEASMDSIFETALSCGFEYEIAYDCVLDMFGNVTCERTMMWEHCVFMFTWKN